MNPYKKTDYFDALKVFITKRIPLSHHIST